MFQTKIVEAHRDRFNRSNNLSEYLLGSRMASRSLSKTLRTSLARQLAAPAIRQQTFVTAVSRTRTTLPNAFNALACTGLQQTRGVKTIDFAGHKEKVYGKCLANRWRRALGQPKADLFVKSVRIGREKSYWYAWNLPKLRCLEISFMLLGVRGSDPPPRNTSRTTLSHLLAMVHKDTDKVSTCVTMV